MSNPSKAGMSHATSSAAEPRQAVATEFVHYETEEGQTRMECRIVDDSLQRPQAHKADLFQPNKQNINFYVKNVLAEGELQATATAEDYLTVQTDGMHQVRRMVQFYNFDLTLTKKGAHNAA